MFAVSSPIVAQLARNLLCSAILGLRRSNLVRDLLPNSSSAGEEPVVLCGVILYVNRTLASLVEKVPDVSFLRPFFTICTALSASPFEAGWYGAEVVCFTPFFLRTSSNS